MTDTVYIRGLRLETVIGVYAWERELRQELRVDLEMATDAGVAAASDDVADALDYAAVSARLREFAAQSSFLLIEKMVDEIATLVMREFGVRWLRVQLSKAGAVTAADDVGIVIERGERAP